MNCSRVFNLKLLLFLFSSWLVMAEENMEKKEFDERLIMEVEANPSIYSKAERSYSDRYKKENVWQNIAFILNTDVKICKERWKNLRDTFGKYYKRDKNIPSGSEALPKKRPWPYFEIMKFLIPNIEVPQTLGNMVNEKENVVIDLSDKEETDEAPTSSNKRLNESIQAPQPRPSKKKKNSDSDTDRFLAALTELNEPDSAPLEKFFLALAQRANSWSRKKQSKLEMRTLQLFHDIEFEDD